MEELKFLFCGLSNAGKTSILRVLDNEPDKIASLKPTYGVNYETFNILNFEIVVWDMGGQISYRRKYLKQYNRYFSGATLLFYIIDLQAPENFQDSLEYLESILIVLRKLGVLSIHVEVFLHKYDPEYQRAIPVLGEQINALKVSIREILGSNPTNFHKTSVFESHTIMYAFSQAVRALVPEDQLLAKVLADVGRDSGALASLLQSRDGFVFGAWHSKQVQLLDLAAFRQIAQDFALKKAPGEYQDFNILPVSKTIEVFAFPFPIQGYEVILSVLVSKGQRAIQLDTQLAVHRHRLEKLLRVLLIQRSA